MARGCSGLLDPTQQITMKHMHDAGVLKVRHPGVKLLSDVRSFCPTHLAGRTSASSHAPACFDCDGCIDAAVTLSNHHRDTIFYRTSRHLIFKSVGRPGPLFKR